MIGLHSVGRLSSVGCICNSPDIKVKGHHHGFCLPLSLPFGRKNGCFGSKYNYMTRLTQHNLLPVCTHSDNIPIYCVCCAGIVHNTVEWTPWLESPILNTIQWRPLYCTHTVEPPILNSLTCKLCQWTCIGPNNCLYEVPNLYKIYWIMWTLNHRLCMIVFYLIQRLSVMTAHCTSLSLPRTARGRSGLLKVSSHCAESLSAY